MTVARPSPLVRVVEWSTLASGWALLLLSFLIAFEVLARKFFQFSLQGVDEIGGYILAVGSAFGFSYALTTRGHVRVDLILLKLSTSLQDWANWVAALGMTIFAYILLWRTIFMYLRTFTLGAKAGTPLDTPLLYPQGLWLFALILFALICTTTLWRLSQVSFFGTGERDALDRALEEEVETEAADARRRLNIDGN